MMLRALRWSPGLWLAMATLVACVPVVEATAHVPDAVDPPVHVDPTLCTPTRSYAYLPLGSEQIAVTGIDEQGDCIVELFAETEGGYTQSICRLPVDASPLVWDPLTRLDVDAEAEWYERIRLLCETVATGNFLMPGAEPVVFPRTAWQEVRSDPSGHGDGAEEAR